MASIKIKLLTWKPTNNNEYPIAISIISDRKRRIIYTGYSCTEELWDTKTGYPKKKHPLFKELVVILDKKKLDATKLLLKADEEEKQLSADDIKTALKRDTRKLKSTIAYFQQTEERLRKAGKIGYANVFKETCRNIKNHIGENADLTFQQVDYNFLKKYEEWNLARGMKLNSLFVFMRTFKTLLNNAKKEQLVPEDYSPFKDYDFKKFRRIKTAKRALNQEELDKLIAHKVPEEDKNSNPFNYFKFSFYCRGINFTDIAFLKWQNIKGNRLEYIRKKTNERFTMELLPPALEIITQYKQQGFTGNDQYIFPILNEKHVTPVQIDNRIEKVLKQTNKGLKELAAQIGIEGKVTTYVARHTFATTLKRKGVSTSLIKELMGHDSEKTTEIYLAGFGDGVLDEAVKAILN
jgi:integrase/recombinase XerD